MRIHWLICVFLHLHDWVGMTSAGITAPVLQSYQSPNPALRGAQGFSVWCNFTFPSAKPHPIIRRLSLHRTTSDNRTYVEITNIIAREFPLQSDSFSSFTRPDVTLRTRVRLSGFIPFRYIRALFSDTRCEDAIPVYKCVLEYQLSVYVKYRSFLESTIQIQVSGCSGGNLAAPVTTSGSRRYIPVDKVWPDPLKPAFTILAASSPQHPGNPNRNWVWCNYTDAAPSVTREHEYRRIVVYRTPAGGPKTEITNIIPNGETLDKESSSRTRDVKFMFSKLVGQTYRTKPWVGIQVSLADCKEADSTFTCELEYYYPRRVLFRYKLEAHTKIEYSAMPAPPGVVTSDVRNARVYDGDMLTFYCTANVGAPAGEIHWYTLSGVENSPMINVSAFATSTNLPPPTASVRCIVHLRKSTLKVRVYREQLGHKFSVRCRVYHPLLANLNPNACTDVGRHYCQVTPFIFFIGRGPDPDRPQPIPPPPSGPNPPAPGMTVKPAEGAADYAGEIGQPREGVTFPGLASPGGEAQQTAPTRQKKKKDDSKFGKSSELVLTLTLSTGLCVLIMVIASISGGSLMWVQRRRYKQWKAADEVLNAHRKDSGLPKIELITTPTPDSDAKSAEDDGGGSSAGSACNAGSSEVSNTVSGAPPAHGDRLQREASNPWDRIQFDTGTV
ncbi:uncharacterized protein [Littorina saxatilis]|uniref:Ig-like domain-containing protein n=1 Tax=Littorina saxatilis TaxID=31220 RepID=A0AAN9FX59_9CAEN